MKTLLSVVIVVFMLSACSPAGAVAIHAAPVAGAGTIPAAAGVGAVPLITAAELPLIGIGLGGLKTLTLDEARQIEDGWLADEQHAEERHGAGIVGRVDDCLARNFLLKMFNPMTKRYASICQEVETGRFLIRVDENDGSLVTSFLNKAKIVDAVIDYLKNRGYQQ